MSPLVLSLLIGVNVEMGVTDHQKVAQRLPWTWSNEKASLDYCLKKLGDYKGTENSGTVHIWKSGKEVYRFEAHLMTVFAVSEGTFFVAVFTPSCTGCRVMAVSLQSGKVLWNVPLRGIGAVAHSAYSNRVNIECDGTTVTVWGKETLGRYVEILDAKTGKMLGHKRFPRIVSPN